MNLYPVTIIESFYENPDSIREFALAQKYTFCHEVDQIGYVYPGCRTKDLSNLDKALYEKLILVLCRFCHRALYPD